MVQNKSTAKKKAMDINERRKIAARLGIAPSTLRERLKKCKERGWPEDYATQNKYWQVGKHLKIRCPDGTLRNLVELGKLFGVAPETVRHRIKLLLKNGESLEELFNKSRWKYRRKEVIYEYDSTQTAPLTDEEKKALEKIPGPSELERKLFG